MQTICQLELVFGSVVDSIVRVFSGCILWMSLWCWCYPATFASRFLPTTA